MILFRVLELVWLDTSECTEIEGGSRIELILELLLTQTRKERMESKSHSKRTEIQSQSLTYSPTLLILTWSSFTSTLISLFPSLLSFSLSFSHTLSIFVTVFWIYFSSLYHHIHSLLLYLLTSLSLSLLLSLFFFLFFPFGLAVNAKKKLIYEWRKVWYKQRLWYSLRLFRHTFSFSFFPSFIFFSFSRFSFFLAHFFSLFRSEPSSYPYEISEESSSYSPSPFLSLSLLFFSLLYFFSPCEARTRKFYLRGG